MINNRTGKYEFNIYRKDAITNVQVKTASCHDPKILRCIFKGFVHRALSICSEKYINDELNVLINVFIENGYKEDDLRKIMEEVISKYNKQINKKSSSEYINTDNNQTISVPWIPGVSPKLRKV